MAKEDYKNKYKHIINDDNYLGCYCELVKLMTFNGDIKWVIAPVYEFAHADVCDIDIIVENCPWDMFLTVASITYRRHPDEAISTTLLNAVDDMDDINAIFKEWREKYLRE